MILGCIPVVTVPAVVAEPVSVPVILVATIFDADMSEVFILPIISKLLVAESNLKLGEVPMLPLLLNRISVFKPGITTFPLILPVKLPIKLPARKSPNCCTAITSSAINTLLANTYSALLLSHPMNPLTGPTV